MAGRDDERVTRLTDAGERHAALRPGLGTTQAALHRRVMEAEQLRREAEQPTEETDILDIDAVPYHPDQED